MSLDSGACLLFLYLGADAKGLRQMRRSQYWVAGTYVPGAAERVQVVYSWILQLIRQRIGEDRTNTPSPTATNMFHMFSEGLYQFEMARLGSLLLRESQYA